VQAGGGVKAERAKNCIRPLPKSRRRVHNARPAKSGRRKPAGLAEEDEKTLQQGVDVLQNRARMCGSPDGMAFGLELKGAESTSKLGVDESKNRAMMGGSPRRKPRATEEGAEAASTIFDSVRR
jgi:hypothetical protein